MIVGIVGHEESKFTPSGKEAAIQAIELILKNPAVTGMTSGHCHLGGIDIWAEEAAGKILQLETWIYPPKNLHWEPDGYKERNLQIARKADHLVCIAVARLASSYSSMKFSACYHCKQTDHVKGGGCWTMKQAKLMGKETSLIIIPNEELGND